MLTNTFCHLPRIGEAIERHLWSAGVMSWAVPLPSAIFRLPSALRQSWDRHMEESIRFHKLRDARYFADRLPSNQHWRLYWEFRESCAYIDIETTGLYREFDEITTIVLYDGRTIRYYVNDKNLEEFPSDVLNYSLLVTYSGKCFDIPFIESFFGMRLPQAHIDLRYPLRSLGLVGGLKGCERQLGMGRPGLEEIESFMAVLLWDEYRKHGNIKALETLLAYNIQDTVTLHTLMVHAHNEKVKATPFAAIHSLPTPGLAEGPFKPDKETVDRLVYELYGLTEAEIRIVEGVNQA